MEPEFWEKHEFEMNLKNKYFNNAYQALSSIPFIHFYRDDLVVSIETMWYDTYVNVDGSIYFKNHNDIASIGVGDFNKIELIKQKLKENGFRSVSIKKKRVDGGYSYTGYSHRDIHDDIKSISFKMKVQR